MFTVRRLIDLPAGWDAEAYDLPSVGLSDDWAASNSADLLDVPCVIIPDERNVLINPKHAAAAKMRMTAPGR